MEAAAGEISHGNGDLSQRTERQAAKNAQREERREARKAAKAEKAATGDTAHQTKADKPAKEHTTTKKESNDNG